VLGGLHGDGLGGEAGLHGAAERLGQVHVEHPFGAAERVGGLRR
jgi:hypothetical protein